MSKHNEDYEWRKKFFEEFKKKVPSFKDRME